MVQTSRAWPAAAASRRLATVREEEELQTVLMQALEEDGPWFIVAKIEEEAEYMPVAPIEPEMTLYRFRNTF